jgi:hypothetical protein
VTRLLTNSLAAIITAAAIGATVSGCGSSSTSAPPTSEAASGTLADACPEIDAVMGGDPDSDPAGTAQKLDQIKAGVTTSDADLIGALATAYADIATNPNVAADQPDGQQMMTALSDASQALGAACQNPTGAPRPN